MTTSLDQHPHRRGKQAAVLTALGFVAVGVTVAAVSLSGQREPTVPTATAPPPRKPASFPRLPVQDGPLPLVVQFVPPLDDPTSFENIRDCFRAAPRRAIRHLERQLAGGNLPPNEYVGRLVL